MKKIYLHVDLDAFFASVEQLDHPEWKGKPVIVGGKPDDRRSVVSTCSYEARKYGVHSAMPSVTAGKLCPDGIFVHPHMKRYSEVSARVMEIFTRFSPDVQQMSIDEAFIDLSGTEKLFGDPENTAMTIKKTVFEETGLTVSIGMASTKYLAKIASDYKKPDGFFHVNEGQETEFMLQLPLKKVWGIGTKTLERLNTKGITTTQNIYDKSESLLISLFGQSTGSFLYRAVRGQEVETFNTEVKNHSISSENTYPFDLTNPFIIDTALMELCHTVMFRLLKEKITGRTVSIKIRYEDFTTVNAQQSSDKDVATLDDLYNRIKTLFYKKYENGRGIRLLGVGLMNTESSFLPRQQDLFDFEDEKKRKVEQAILKAEQKNPELKITKARLLSARNLYNSILLVFMFFAAGNIKAQAQSASTLERNADGAGSIVFDTKKLEEFSEKTDKELFSFDSNKNKGILTAAGYWKTFFTSEITITSGDETYASFSIPVFQQKVDLDLKFLFNDHLFFNAFFEDEFETNTIEAGYKGNSILRELKISNRNISFPETYSINNINRGIGGGKNSAPGIKAVLKDKKWNADAVLRYEQLLSREKKWTGKNSVTEDDYFLTSYTTGSQYVLPSQEALDAIKAIYVEYSSGSYTDSRGRKYKKLDESQYLISKARYSVFLSPDSMASKKAEELPAVAIEFFSDYSARLEADLGDWETDGFLGNTQKLFSVPLKNSSIPLYTQIDGKKVLYVQYSGRFSPFASCNEYDLGLTKPETVEIVNEFSSEKNKSYLTEIPEEEISFVSQTAQSKKHYRARIQLSDQTVLTPLSPEKRFPFARDFPQIYLSGKDDSNLVLRATTCRPVTRLEIGTNAIPGTVRVYKNSIQDSRATYDPESGTVSLSSGISETDRIYIQWYEDSLSDSTGAIAAAAGFNYQFTQNFSGDIAFSTRWAWAPGITWSDDSNLSTGNITASTGLNYQTENLQLQHTAALNVDSKNTAGIWKICGMENSKPQTCYLEKEAGVLMGKNSIVSLNSRDYDSSQSILLKAENRIMEESASAVRNSEISGYAIPLSFNFSSIQEQGLFWSGTELKLSSLSHSLSDSSTFSIALKTEDISQIDYDLYLQLGIDARQENSFEDYEYIPTWKISSDSLSNTVNDGVSLPFLKDKSGWQEVKISISGNDRKILSENYDARLIVVSQKNISGKILAGPYEVSNSIFSVNSKNGSFVSAFEEKCTDSIKPAQKLNKSKNYAQGFDFVSSGIEEYTASFGFDETDISDYQSISLIMKSSGNFSDDDTMELYLERPDFNNNPQTAIKILLTGQELNSFSEWKILEARLNSKTCNSGELVTMNSSIQPVRFKAVLKTSTSGFIKFDELYLSGCKKNYSFQDKVTGRWEKSGTVVSINEKPLIKDVKLSAGTDFNGSLFQAQQESSLIIKDIYVSSQMLHNPDSNYALSSSSHVIETQKNLFNIIGFSDSFSQNKNEGISSRINKLILSGNSYNVPLSLSVNASSENNSDYQDQKAAAELKFSPGIVNTQIKAHVNQKSYTSQRPVLSYFEEYLESAKTAFSTGNENARNRNISASFNLKLTPEKIPVSPEYSFSSSGNFTSLEEFNFNDLTEQKFSIPVKFKRNAFNFSYSRTADSKTLISDTKNYYSDAKNYTDQIINKSWYFSTFIFEDLFSKELKNKVASGSSNQSGETAFSAAYAFTWKKSFSGSLWDFILPQSSTLALERNIISASSISDYLRSRLTASWAGMNIFGKNGIISVTDLFNQDEYITSLTAAIKAPSANPENTSFSISFYNLSSFYLNQKDKLSIGLDFSMEDTDNFAIKTTGIFKRKGKNSLLLEGIKLFTKKLNPAKTSILRSDGFNASYTKSSSSTASNNSIRRRISFAYDHDLDLKLNEYFTVNTGIGLIYTDTIDVLVSINAQATIGATIQF